METFYLPTHAQSKSLVLNKIIPLYCRLISESYRTFDSNAGKAYMSVLDTPIDIQLGRRLIMDEVERVKDDIALVIACSNPLPFRDL